MGIGFSEFLQEKLRHEPLTPCYQYHVLLHLCLLGIIVTRDKFSSILLPIYLGFKYTRKIFPYLLKNTHTYIKILWYFYKIWNSDCNSFCKMESVKNCPFSEMANCLPRVEKNWRWLHSNWFFNSDQSQIILEEVSHVN